MTAVPKGPKTAARLPNLGRLWAGRKTQLRPSPQPTKDITTQIMRRPGVAPPGEASTQRMRSLGDETRHMTPPGDVSTQIMRRPGASAYGGTTRQMPRGGAADDETNIMNNPELFGDDFVFAPRQEELDFLTHRIPRGFLRRKMGQEKTAFRFGRLGGLPGVGKLRGIADYASDAFGGKLRRAGRQSLARGATGPARTDALADIRKGKRRAVMTGGAGALGGAAALNAAGGDGGEPASPQQAVQERLEQRMASPVGGLLDDIINPETDAMARARETKRQGLGEDISLMQRWQLMDPSMRTLLVSLLLGGGLAAGSAALR